jgi:hypothetical protein
MGRRRWGEGARETVREKMRWQNIREERESGEGVEEKTRQEKGGEVMCVCV